MLTCTPRFDMTAQRFTNRPEQMWTYTAWQKKGVDTLLIVPGCAPRCPNTWGDKALTVYPLSAEEKAFMAKHNVRIVEVRYELVRNNSNGYISRTLHVPLYDSMQACMQQSRTVCLVFFFVVCKQTVSKQVVVESIPSYR